MKYLPDSNVLIGLFAGVESISTRFRHFPANEFGLSAVVLHELLFGAYKSRRQTENLQRLEQLRLTPVPFEAGDALRAAEIRAALKNAGRPIGPYDVLIAGQALARDLIVVTANTREFLRVQGLRVENWEA